MKPSITEIKVRGYHMDFYGHINNARYLELLEEGRWSLSLSLMERSWRFVSGFLNLDIKAAQ